jgi:hypothetical protein
MTPSFYPDRNCWRVVVPAKLSDTRKRYPKYFKTPSEAEDFIATFSDRQVTRRAVFVSDADRTFLEYAKKKLGSDAAELIKAADFYHKRFLSVSKTGTMQQMCDAFYQFQVGEGRSKKTLADDRSRLKAIARAFTDLDPRELTNEEIFNWVHSFKPGNNRANMFKGIKKLVRWAKRVGYLGIELMEDMEKPETESSISVLSIGHFEAVLRYSAGIDPLPPLPARLKPQYGYKLFTDFSRILPVFVLGGLAGLRTSEMLKIYVSDQVVQWEDINWEENHIHIRKEVAKKTKRKNNERWIPLEPAVVAWLKLAIKPSGPVVDLAESAFREYRRQLLARLKISFPINALRNSYASYAYTFRSCGDVAKAMGDLDETIERNYLNKSLKPNLGKAWFNIRPDANKILQMPKFA